MRGKQIQKIYDLADSLDKQISKKGLKPLISNGLSRFNFNVYVIHEEGTVFNYKNAYAVIHTDEQKRKWLIIVPEHHDVNVMSMDEIYHYSMTKNVSIPRSKIK